MSIYKYPVLIFLPLAPEIQTDVLWDLTLVFSGLGFLYFLFIFFFKNRLAHKTKGVRARKKELGPMISNFLFYEEDASLQEKYNYVQLKLEIRDLLKDKFNRKVLVDILLDLQKDISGDARNRLFKLYQDLGLHQDAFQKLKSWRWEVISKGILELTLLQVEESYGFIKKFINHKRSVIRKQAQMATVSLKHEGIVYFLDTCKHRISEWQQLKLLDVIRNLEDFQPPRFKAWLTAKNKDVVLFSLRLIKYYNQNDANISLIELVKHKNDQIKIEAINCIKEFLVFDAIDTLKAVFWKCNPSVKLVLLDAIAALGKENEISFLDLVGRKESNFMVKSKALSAINIISPESVMPTHGIESLPDYNPAEEELEIVEPEIQEVQNTKAPYAGVPEKNNPLKVEEKSQVTNTESEIIREDFISEIPEEVTEQAEAHYIEQLEFTFDKASTDNDSFENDDHEPVEEMQFHLHEEAQTSGQLNEITINDPEEIIMEHNQEDQNEPEEIYEVFLENDNKASISNEETTNSEEAYWEVVLDPEREDESIFDICLIEELENILELGVRPEESWAPHEILSLSFLPIVEREEQLEPDKEEQNSNTIFDIEVVAEVVHEDEKFEEELDRILQRIRTSEEEDLEEIVLDFIPIVTDVEELISNENPDPHSEIQAEEPFPDKEGEPISEVMKEEELTIALPWESIETTEEPPTEQEILREISINVEEVIPSEFSPNIEEKSADAIFELNAVIAERVSIFNELFRTCDAESKLILLDEILAVGDERDLKFLDTLATDEDERVRSKAKSIGEKLKDFLFSASEETLDDTFRHDTQPEGEAKDSLFETNPQSLIPLEYCFLDEKEIITSEHTGEFVLDLELSTPTKATSQSTTVANRNSTEDSTAQTSLLEEILSIPSKLIQKLNG